MEPFTIVCATCQSRIRVRNVGLVGQLVNCPKCKSIVLVDPPSDRGQGKGRDVSPVDSRALTKDGMDPSAAGLAFEEPSDTDEFRLLPVESDELVAVHQARPPTSVANPLIQGTEHLGNVDPIEWQTGRRASPNEVWTSSTTARTRQFLMVGFLGTTSVLITGLLFILFLRWYYHPGVEAEAQSARTSNSAEEVGALDSTVSRDVTSTVPQEETVLPPDHVSTPSPEKNEVLISDDQATESNSAENALADVVSSIDVVPSTNIEGSQDADAAIANSESLQLEASEGPVETLPPRLRELAGLIGEPFDVTLPQSMVVPDRAPVTAEELGISGATIDKALPPVDLHVTSNQRIVRGLRLDNVSLAHAVNYLSLAGGMPIVVDANTLAAANIDRAQRVSFIIDSGTFAEVIHKFAQQIGLQLQAVENRYFRLYAGAPSIDLLPATIEIDDLITSDADHQWLRNMLDQFFPQVSSGLSVDGSRLVADPGVVDRLTWFAVARSLDNWRSQQSLPPRLTEYQSSNLRVPLVVWADMVGFDQPLKHKSTAARPLASLLTSVSAESQIECWADWPSLERIGLGPSTPVTSVTWNRSLRSLLQELEFEFGLTTIIVDEKTIWLTSPETYRHSPDIFVIPSEGKAMEFWAQYFRPLTPVGPDGVSSTELMLTLDGKYVFVRSCRPTLKFQ